MSKRRARPGTRLISPNEGEGGGTPRLSGPAIASGVSPSGEITATEAAKAAGLISYVLEGSVVFTPSANTWCSQHILNEHLTHNSRSQNYDVRDRFKDGGVGHDGGFSPRGMADSAPGPDGRGGDGTYHDTSGKGANGSEDAGVEVLRWRKDLDYNPQTSFTGGRLRTWTGELASG